MPETLSAFTSAAPIQTVNERQRTYLFYGILRRLAYSFLAECDKHYGYDVPKRVQAMQIEVGD